MSIIKLRKSKGLTVRDIAEEMRIAPSYYSHMENGRRKFQDEYIEKCALILDTPVEVIRELVNQIKDKSILNNSWLTNIRIQGKNVISAFQEELYLEPVISKDELFQRFAQFVRMNIGQSIMEELRINQELADKFAERYGVGT